MKTRIEPKDIRKGDLIRVEDGEVEDAREYRAQFDEHTRWARRLPHYLLDRPEPVVDLLSEPTLGWLHVTDTGESSTSGPGRILGVFKGRDGVVDGGPVGSWSREFITGFTPATAVPTSALNELRKRSKCYSDPDSPTNRFFDAVDEATS